MMLIQIHESCFVSHEKDEGGKRDMHVQGGWMDV